MRTRDNKTSNNFNIHGKLSGKLENYSVLNSIGDIFNLNVEFKIYTSIKPLWRAHTILIFKYLKILVK